MSFEKALVVDDELIIRKTLQQILHKKRFSVCAVENASKAAEMLEGGTYEFDLMFLDINLPDGEGTELLEKYASGADGPLAIMITGQGSIESAVHCMRLGAFDYIQKPFSAEQIEMVVRKAEKFTRLMQVNQYLSSETRPIEQKAIVGQSQAVRELQELIGCVARTDATVMISGESGTGKELIAQSIYEQSHRSKKPFIKVNCAAVSETLIESEFFGHEKGAFTGALQGRIGRFEMADGGTLLLDEISEVSLPLQAKLLRVLQEKELERVGGNKTIQVDVRIIATTNRDLMKSVRDGAFREDLYYRLNVFPVQSPPLRERGDDVGILAEYFLKVFSRKHGRNLNAFSRDALALLNAHSWPGNVRELQNTIERAVILSPNGTRLEATALPMDLRMLDKAGGAGIAPAVEPEPAAGERLANVTGEESVAAVVPGAQVKANRDEWSLAAVERQLILDTLRHTDGNRTKAAELMQVSIRTLRNKLSAFKEAGDTEFEPFLK